MQVRYGPKRRAVGIASRALLFACALGSSPLALAEATPDAPHLPEAGSPLSVSGYVESFWQWNFARPWNDITHYRAFDNRHNSFTLANVAVDAQWDARDVVGRLALQFGHTADTYYASEPVSPATPGANASGPELWKYLQQANVGYRFRLGSHALLVQTGIFLSPIGPESMVVHENWHWSRSNLFFALPFYHTGARATADLSEHWTLALAAYNGWNSVVDNNGEKSVAIDAVYSPSSALALGLLYFGGRERAPEAVEGKRFRHLFDGHVTLQASAWLTLRAELNAGFEPTRLGNSRWLASQLSARLRLHRLLDFAARADLLTEHVPARGAARAAPIFFPAEWVSSGTATLDFHPDSHISFRLEYRHDHAASAMYFGRRAAAPETPSERRQDTLTVGATAWF